MCVCVCLRRYFFLCRFFRNLREQKSFFPGNPHMIFIFSSVNFVFQDVFAFPISSSKKNSGKRHLNFKKKEQREVVEKQKLLRKRTIPRQKTPNRKNPNNKLRVENLNNLFVYLVLVLVSHLLQLFNNIIQLVSIIGQVSISIFH